MNIEYKELIRDTIQAFSQGNLTDNALKLFENLGYNTIRQNRLRKNNFEEFKASFIQPESKFNIEKAFVSEWKYIDILFQLSKYEILNQNLLFDAGRIDNKIIESYLKVEKV